eukprot:500453-Rhodomonas_salina.2
MASMATGTIVMVIMIKSRRCCLDSEFPSVTKGRLVVLEEREARLRAQARHYHANNDLQASKPLWEAILELEPGDVEALEAYQHTLK